QDRVSIVDRAQVGVAAPKTESVAADRLRAHRSPDTAGANRIDSNAAMAELAREHLRQCDDAEFARTVGTKERVAREARDGRDEDDAAVVGQRPRRFTADEKRARE